VSTDDLFRAGAVVAAVAIVAAPYRQQAAAWLAQAATAVAPYRWVAARAVAAGLLLYAAWGRLPEIPAIRPPVAPVTVEEPSADIQAAVAGVAKALAVVSQADRAVWRETWAKSAIVVEADRAGQAQAFPKTPSLRDQTTIALDIAWRRIAGHKPGSVAGLKDAVEAAYAAVLGDKDVPVTPEIRERYADLARGMVWAAR
jgi:hypothetical protein